MRAAVTALALAGCTQVFDLEGTHIPSESDARCPPIGETPRFTRALTQLLPRNCDGYNYATARRQAVAACHANAQSTVEAGPVDGPLAPVAGISPRDAGAAVAYTSQDEARIYFFGVDSLQAEPFTLDVYRRQPDNTWLLDPALHFSSPNANARLGAVAFDGDRDRAVLSENTTLTEYAIDTTWTAVRTFSAADLGVDIVGGFSLTAIGLRATFFGVVGQSTGQFYTDRASVDDPFRRGERLEVSSYTAAFMSDDCGRIYVAGVGSIFYAKQAL